MDSQSLKQLYIDYQRVSVEHTDTLLNRAFLHADGFFTSFLIENGKICAFHLHLQRIEHGCKVLELDYPELLSPDNLTAFLQKFTEKEPVRVRVMVWRKQGNAYQVKDEHQAQVGIVIQPYDKISPNVHLISVLNPRIPNQVLPSSVKWLSGVNSILAQQEAYKKGGNLALQSTMQGHISEAAHACIGWFLKDIFYYPDASCDALPGTTLEEFRHYLEMNKIPLQPIAQPIASFSYDSEILLFNSTLGAFTPKLFNSKTVNFSKKTVDFVQSFNHWRLENAYVLKS
jgi:branched-subunit amino acid aminotransferase/4-amino-4-deoxychorismate lyase